jgi:peptidyl-prolyl cis-trans isomerase C
MKSSLLLFALAASALAQNAPPPALAANPQEVTPETVVAEVEGKKYTAGDINKLADYLPPQMRPNFTRDPKAFLSQWFMLKKVASMAEAEKLDQKSPYKEGLEIQRMSLLMQALVNEQSTKMPVTPEEQKKAYEARKDEFTQAKVKIIYIPFSTGPAPPADGAKKPMTEAEALAKAETVVKQGRAGTDFVALVKQYSEDPISKDAGGDFGPIKKGDKLPDAVKQAVFALKPGEISEPVRQPNGYYVFRLSELQPQAFEEVQEVLFNEMRNQRMKEWMDKIAKSTEVKVQNEAYFNQIKK